MRYVPIIAAALALAGCDAFTGSEEKAARACEGFITAGLRSPSTYKRISFTAAPADKGKAFRYVSVTYDADNAFGTPIRGAQVCAFKVDPASGDFPSGEMMESSASLANAEKTLREVQQMAGKKVPDMPVGGFECCVAQSDAKAAADSF